MNVTVTGGAGFIGANLCRRLLQTDGITSVTVIDDLSTGSRMNLEGLEVELVQASILDTGALDEAVSAAHAIVHLAAIPSVPRSIDDPVRSHEANASGTVAVLEAARRSRGAHVIVASSSSVYGANPTLPKRESLSTLPMSPYAASKLATESYALAYQTSFALPVLAFRFFNVFGPLQPAGHAYAAVIPAFVSAALADEPLRVHGDGTQTRDFTYVGTVAEVITEALLRRVTSPTPVNLAFGTRTDLLTLIALMETLLERSLERHHAPPRTGDVKSSQADSSRLKELFPSITPVDLETGLRATIEWFRDAQR